MAKYIPLDAVLAEIDRLFDLHSSKHDIDEAGVVLLQLRENIETIEAKEIELDMKTFGEEMTNVFNLPSNETTNTEEEPLNWEYAIAKHFFELGLRASNPLTWEDMLIIHRCIKDAMNYHLYAFQSVEGQQKVYEEVLKRFKAQKGE